MTTSDEELAERAEALADEVGRLNREVEKLNRRGIRAVYAVILLFVLLGAMAILVNQQFRTSDKLEGVIQRSLCPVYGLVVGSFDPSTRPDTGPKPTPRDQYIATFQVMRDAYTDLQCTAPLVPKKTTP
jgi:hypothetical protein